MDWIIWQKENLKWTIDVINKHLKEDHGDNKVELF